MEDEVYIIQGALSLTLQISRVLGIAPIKFKSFQNGYKISLSRIFVICSYFLGFIFNIIAVFAVLVESNLFVIKKSFSSSVTAFDTLWELHIIAMIITILTGCYSAKSRMKYLIKHLILLEEIKLKINHNDNYKSNEKRKIAIVLLFLIKQSILFGLNSVQTILVMGLTNGNSRSSRLLNVKEEVRHLNESYVSVCEAVATIDAAEGFYSFLLFTSSLVLNIIFAIFNIVAETRNSGTRPMIFTAVYVGLTILFLLKLIIFVESCHASTLQISYMQNNLSKLILLSTPVGKRVPLEMDMMYKELILIEPTFSPLGIFKIDRSLILTTCSGIITYSIFMVQLKLNRT